MGNTQAYSQKCCLLPSLLPMGIILARFQHQFGSKELLIASVAHCQQCWPNTYCHSGTVVKLNFAFQEVSKIIFSPAQLAEIERTTLSGILCEHSDNLEELPESAFRTQSDILMCEERKAKSFLKVEKWIDNCEFSNL